MNNLEEFEIIEEHIKNNMSYDFINNCLLAVGYFDLKIILNNKFYNILKFMLKNKKIKCNLYKKLFDLIDIKNVIKKDDNDTCEIIKIFLECGADPTIGNNYFIRYAQNTNNNKIYDLLVNWSQNK